MPTHILEIAYSNPGDPREWEDESDRLVSFSFSRGKQNESAIDQPTAGTGTFVLDNLDGRFSPENASGPHYPNVIPLRALRLSVQIPTGTSPFTMRASNVGGNHPLRGGEMTFPLFYGFIERWPHTWETSDTVATVAVQASDAFSIFTVPDFVWGERYLGSTGEFFCGTPSGTDIVPDNGPVFIPDDVASVRIGRVLDCLDWPNEDRDVDTGTVTILGSASVFLGTANFKVSENALSHMQAVAVTEGGEFFVGRDGRVRFIDADHLPELEASEVYGDIDGELRYYDIQTDSGIDRLWNDITVNSTESGDISPATAVDDAAGIKRFLVARPKTFTVLPVASGMQDRADALLERYKDPVTRITELRPRVTDEAIFRQVVAHELADRVLVRRRPPNADGLEQDSRIEGIAISAPVSAQDPGWSVVWRLSAAAAATVPPGGGGEGFDSDTFDSSTFGA